MKEIWKNENIKFSAHLQSLVPHTVPHLWREKNRRSKIMKKAIENNQNKNKKRKSAA
jgi:hypothetical protein